MKLKEYLFEAEEKDAPHVLVTLKKLVLIELAHDTIWKTSASLKDKVIHVLTVGTVLVHKTSTGRGGAEYHAITAHGDRYKDTTSFTPREISSLIGEKALKVLAKKAIV